MSSLVTQPAPLSKPAATARGAERPLRIALIGCGKMGQEHLRAIRTLAHARLVGVADPFASREELGDLLPPDARLFDDAEVMLEELRPDVVHVVTPPGSHATLALAALRAGSHVYVEKPFSPTKAEAEAIMDMAAARGLQVCAGHQCLMNDAATQALEALPQIGRLVHVESVLSFKMVRRTITPVEQAMDILPHAVYPLVEQLRAGTGSAQPIEVCAVEAGAEGDIYALLKLGRCTGVLIVTLSGRPIEQYQHLVGTNGSLRADYVVGGLVKLVGPGAGVGVLFTPYRRAFQTIKRAVVGMVRLLVGRGGSYRGLGMLIERFYASVQSGGPPSIQPRSIIDTVAICERIGLALDDADDEAEAAARSRLAAAQTALPAVVPDRGVALVTGGTGFLGRSVAEELRQSGFAVRVLSRRTPRFAERVPGVEYFTADLAQPLDDSAMQGVALLVHCAAETAGGRAAHERNSVAATQHAIEAAARARVTRVVHVSSLAVLKPTGRVLDEQSPVDVNNPERGPYVWGKATSEETARSLALEHRLSLKIIRPGPLVDFRAFQPPGRLGREIGPWFVAVGSKRSPLSVCDVRMVARVIRSYAKDFDAAPDLINLVDTPPLTRGELVERLRRERPDLRFLWLPALLVRWLNGPAKLLQRVAFGSRNPVDVYAAFSSEKYDTRRAADVISRAGVPR